MTRFPRIEVEIRIDDRRRERSERAVLSALASRPIPRVADPRRRWPWLLVPIAASAVLGLVLMREPSERPLAMSPSLVTTPVGGSSRFTVGDAVIDAGSDTSVTIGTAGLAETTLTLLRGTIDCEVPPRADRPPFRVIAGDVIVDVIGTRFTVRRTGEQVRVDVTRGKVAVTARAIRHLVVTGESWPAEPAPIATTAEPVAPQEPVKQATRPRRPAPTLPEPARLTFQDAQRMETTDPVGAARAYRTLARGNDRWAALALLSLAELHAGGAPDDALRELAELERRFPDSSNAEEAAWLRVDLLRATGRTEEARRAAAAYVRKYPRGTYARQAARLLQP